MNIQKLIAIVAAILINCAVLAWFHAWTSSVTASAVVPHGQARKIVTLPIVEVRPSAEQLRALQHTRAAVSGQRGVHGVAAELRRV